MKNWLLGLLGALALAAVLLVVFWRPVSETAALATHRIVDVTFDPAHPEDFRINAKDVRCGADLVESVQSRVYTNQGDLEFWCREKDQPLPVFKNIGKAIPEQAGSAVQNVSGRLYESVSESFYEDGKWSFWNHKHHAEIDNGRTINLQERDGKIYRFVVSGARCPGLSVFSDDGYHGTYQGKDWPEWSATYTDGHIVAINVGRRMHVGPLPAATRFEKCRPLSLKPVGPPDWVYAIAPVQGGLLYGGVAEPPYTECAKLRFLDIKTLAVSSISLPNCMGSLVTEYYSFARFGKIVLIGNYPYARLYAFDPASRKVWLTDIAKMRPEDKYYQGHPYRESQSVLPADGSVMIGLYPWSDLLVVHDGQTDSIRILKKPTKNSTDLVPFETTMSRYALRVLGLPQTTELTPEQDDNLRSRALSKYTWAQRIPSIAMFSGKVCLSTASFSGYTFDKQHQPLPADAGNSYGDVFCANVPNHVLVEHPKSPVRLILTDRYMGIERNGVAVKVVTHHLSQDARDEIASAMRSGTTH